MKNIYFLGPKGSYSHIIAMKVFEKNAQLIPCNSFSEIVQNATKEKESISILPIENSITSNVHENMGYLFKENLVISYETHLQINLYLIGLKNSNKETITDVYSHPKALAQSDQYILTHHLKTHEATSTAAGIDMLLEKRDDKIGIIGSKELANNPDFMILDEKIGDNENNMTRFVFVGTRPFTITSEIKNKTSIMFTVPHVSGSLAKVLTAFAEAKFNLTKIDSLPLPGTKWEYQFWIDIENSTQEIDRIVLSEILSTYTDSYKIIGIYPQGKIYES